MRKPEFCQCENKGADQLRSNCEADQRLCFRHSDSTISLLPKSEISSFLPFSETAHTGLCRTWSETPNTGFLASRLNFDSNPYNSRLHAYFDSFEYCYETTEYKTFEPVHEKTNNLGFRPGPTQTSLYSHRRNPES